jgi:hypothetical protein
MSFKRVTGRSRQLSCFIVQLLDLANNAGGCHNGALMSAFGSVKCGELRVVFAAIRGDRGSRDGCKVQL